MTSKLKCPFCGKKLWYDEQDGIYRCMKSACVMDYEGGTEQLWQTLIQAKQDLEYARKALEELRGDKRLPPQTHWETIADKALEQITHDNSEKANSVEHKE